VIAKVKTISPRPVQLVELALSDAIACAHNADPCRKLIQEFDIDLSKPITDREEDCSHCDAFDPYASITYVRTHPLFMPFKYVVQSDVQRNIVSAMFSAKQKPDFEAMDKGKTMFQRLFKSYKLEEETLGLFLSEPTVPRAGI
jgi:hypothetical protein